MNTLGALLVVAILGVGLLVRRILFVGRAKSSGHWLPTELNHATLAYSEQRFIASAPVSLGAIVDRVYRRPDQQLVLVEFKRRDRAVVHDSDIVELSVQRLALEGASRESVSEYAYVVVYLPGTERMAATRVRLQSKDEIEALIARRSDVLNGVMPPRRAHLPGLCESCAFKVECRAMR